MNVEPLWWSVNFSPELCDDDESVAEDELVEADDLEVEALVVEGDEISGSSVM